MADNWIFDFERDWMHDVPLMIQAKYLIHIRCLQGHTLAECLLTAMAGVDGLPKGSLAWLWFNALLVVAKDIEKPKAKL